MIENTLSTLHGISDNKDKQTLYVLGGYVVGATIVLDDIDNIYKEYPLLEIVAELGSDLETLKDDKNALPVFEEFQYMLHRLKQSLSKK